MTPTTSPTVKSDEAMAKRRSQVVELRLGGHTFQRIADALKISKSAAHRHYREAIKEHNDATAETVSELRTINHMRLEKMITHAWRDAVPSDSSVKSDPASVDRVMRLMAQDAKLMGYDSPQKHQIDLQMVSTSISVVVECIVNSIPEEYLPAVQAAVEQGMIEAQALNNKSTLQIVG